MGPLAASSGPRILRLVPGPTRAMVRFDRFRFDLEDRWLGDASGRVPLNFKALEVLRVLIARRERLVRKDELLDEVWPDVHVGDGVLKVRMSEIRKALGDSAKRPRFIETIHRRGYRFIAEASDDRQGG